MMEFFAAAATGAWVGALHGIGPDHCAALATLLAHEHAHDGSKAVRISLRFGLGHALALATLAALTTSLGVVIPASWETGAEIFGALLLITLGALVLKRDFDLVAHRHDHDHAADAGLSTTHPHEHWHLHIGVAHAEHRHLHVAALTGGTLAFSGVRALALALPPLLVAGQSWLTAGAFVVAFGVGVTAAMVLVGLILGAALRAGERAQETTAPRWIRWSIGVGAIGLGVWWIWVRVA